MASSGSVFLILDVRQLIKSREKADIHTLFRDSYERASFKDESPISDYIDHVVRSNDQDIAVKVLTKLLNRRRYPELSGCFTSNIKKDIRKVAALKARFKTPEEHQVGNDDSFLYGVKFIR
jgi:hypothetical protein